MKDEIIIAGAGGQGVLALGKILAEAAVEQGKNVSFYPSYGAEMRGGTTNCAVIISDEEIGSPTISKATSLIVMNTQSFNKFLPKLAKNGVLFYNSSMIEPEKAVESIGLRTYKIPATAIAQELGDVRCANMALLGAYTGVKKTVTAESAQKIISAAFSKKPEVVKLNIEAFNRGLKEIK